MKIALMLMLLGAATATLAKDSVAPVNATRQSLAIKGYDPVAYFKDAKPVQGNAAFTFDWSGAKWQFVSKENRDAFAAAPDKYAPQYGGYCAWAVGHGYTADTDPQAWKIVDGKLYLNYSKSVQEKWLQDSRKWIDSADKNWPGLHK